MTCSTIEDTNSKNLGLHLNENTLGSLSSFKVLDGDIDITSIEMCGSAHLCRPKY